MSAATTWPVVTQFADRILPIVDSIRGAADVGLSSKGQRPELQVDLNRGLAGTLGVTVGQVAQSLRPAFAGVHAGDWVDPTGKTRDVTVRLAPEFRTNSGRPRAAAARARAGDGGADGDRAGGADGRSRSGQVATITTTLGPAEIDHLDRDELVDGGRQPGRRGPRNGLAGHPVAACKVPCPPASASPTAAR